jgi:hypothetical protein
MEHGQAPKVEKDIDQGHGQKMSFIAESIDWNHESIDWPME